MVGIDCQNKAAIDSRYICYKCTFILRDPVQLFCGHRFCQTCVDDEEKESIRCLHCKTVESKSKMFLDRGMKNDMKSLSVCCSICHWNGLLGDYQAHSSIQHSRALAIRSSTYDLIRKLSPMLDELTKNVHKLKLILEQLVFQTSIYKLSIEEQTPPDTLISEQQDSLTVTDGTLLWKIDDIKSRLNSDTDSILTSPPFRTSAYGYKMCVRLHLNGNGQSTHASIFLILMRGDYDAVIEWPFDYQITFCLCNINNQKHHIIESFRSDVKSRSFQQPQADLNLGSGISHFFPKSLIQQDNSPYLCEDSIFIKIMVMKDWISTVGLRTIMNIDPAWPLYKREEIIQREIEKHKMQPHKLTLTLKFQSI